MDLHTIVKNLHTGKKSISDKHFSTILSISEITSNDSKIVGDYYSNLALLKELTPNNIAKEGFILTHQGILVLLQENSLLKNLTNALRKNNLKNIDETAKSLKQIIQSITFSELLQVQLLKAYHNLQEQYPNLLLRTKISFSHNKDKKIELPQNDFSYINREEDLFKSIISSLLNFYTRDNLYLREQEGIDESEISLAIGFEVINPVTSSGICSSLDFKSGHTSLIQIHSSFGDEVYNRVHLSSTDSYQIFKKGFEEGYSAILPPQIAKKKHSLTLTKFNSSSTLKLENRNISKKNEQEQSLNNTQIKQICSLLLKIESSLIKYFKTYTPVKLYFSISSNNEDKTKSQISIEDLVFEQKHTNLEEKDIALYELLSPQTTPIARGIAIGNTITHGFVKHIHKESDLYSISNEDIILAHSTFPHWEPYLKNAKGLVIEQGDDLSHCAQICYEYNIPAIINTGSIQKKISNKSVITLNCSKEEGELYINLEKYSIKTLSTEQKDFKKKSNFKLQNIVELAQITNKDNILEKVHLPFNSQIIENIYDLIPKKFYSQKFNKNISTYQKTIRDEIIRQLSKIAISKYPQNIWINLASFSPIYYEIITKKESTYLKCSKVDGISRVLEPAFEEHIKFLVSIINEISKTIGCDNIYLYIDSIEQRKEVKQLKDILSKYEYKNKLGGVVNVGGLLNIDELIEYFDMLSCDLNSIKLSCGTTNFTAIIKLVRYFILKGEELTKSKNSTQIGLFNLSINDIDIMEQLKNNYPSIISCKDSDIIPIYSYLSEKEKNKKVKDSKFVKRIEFK